MSQVLFNPTQYSDHLKLWLAFSTDHAIVCHKGGFHTSQCIEVRNITAHIATELHLQSLSRESVTHYSAVTSDGAGLDIHTIGFWDFAQDAFLMFGFFTQTHQATVQDPLRLPTRNIKPSINEHMVHIYLISSMMSSHHVSPP